MKDAGDGTEQDAGGDEEMTGVCVLGLHVECFVGVPELPLALTRWNLARPVGMAMDARCLLAL